MPVAKQGDVRSVRPADLAAPHPVYCIWELTLKCDLACTHCGSRAGTARRNELTTAEALDVVDQLAEIGVREVGLIGGEAYLRDDWPVIAQAIAASGMRCDLVTGGRRLDDAQVAKAVAAGVYAISVSVDGLQATHDQLRGVKGSWQAAMASAQRIRAAGIHLLVNTQINRASWRELDAVAALLVDLGVRAWQIQLTVAMGRAADRPELLLQPFELDELFPLLADLKQQVLDPAGIQLFPANNIGYFGPWERRLRPGGDKGQHWTGCGAGMWSLGIEADGTLKGCPSLPTVGYAGGSLRDRRLRDLVANAEPITHVSRRTKADLWGFCGSCYYADVCLGGCTWTSHSLLGRPGNNPMCIHRVTELKRQGLRERLVQVERAPGRPFDHGRFEIEVEAWDDDTMAER